MTHCICFTKTNVSYVTYQITRTTVGPTFFPAVASSSATRILRLTTAAGHTSFNGAIVLASMDFHLDDFIVIVVLVIFFILDIIVIVVDIDIVVVDIVIVVIGWRRNRWICVVCCRGRDRDRRRMIRTTNVIQNRKRVMIVIMIVVGIAIFIVVARGHRVIVIVIGCCDSCDCFWFVDIEWIIGIAARQALSCVICIIVVVCVVIVVVVVVWAASVPDSASPIPSCHG
jgi:hypothetical protein